MTYSKDIKEELIGSEFNFNETTIVEIELNHNIESDAKFNESSFVDEMHRFEIFAVCLNKGQMLNEKSILYYNKFSNNENSLSLSEGISCLYNPDNKHLFSLDIKKLAVKYDEILFFTGRTQTNAEFIENVADEIYYIDCTLEKDFLSDSFTIKNIKYDYNKFGTMLLFGLENSNENWCLDLNHVVYKSGINEIIEKYLKTDNNK
jgi:hypothetical protein